jgi:hypothetical protein
MVNEYKRKVAMVKRKVAMVKRKVAMVVERKVRQVLCIYILFQIIKKSNKSIRSI